MKTSEFCRRGHREKHISIEHGSDGKNGLTRIRIFQTKPQRRAYNGKNKKNAMTPSLGIFLQDGFSLCLCVRNKCGPTIGRLYISFFGVIRGYRFLLSLHFFAALADIFMPLYEKCFIRWTTPFVVRLALGENFELAHHDFGYKY